MTALEPAYQVQTVQHSTTNTRSKKKMNKNSPKTILAIATIAVIASMGFAFAFTENQVSSQNVQDQFMSSVHIDIDKKTVKQMSEESSHIVTGKIKNIEPQMANILGSNVIMSDVTIKVENDVAKTLGQKEITVKVVGGTIGELTTESEILSHLNINDKVLVFVSDEPNTVFGDNYMINGESQGIYKIVNGKTSGVEYSDITEQDLISKIKKDRSS